MNGDVTIRLGDETVTLKCTLGAAMKIDQDVGGVVAAFRAVSQGNLSAIGDIIAAGSGMPNEAAREAAFRAGVASLIDPVTEFVGLCASGGRKPKASGKDAGKGEG